MQVVGSFDQFSLKMEHQLLELCAHCGFILKVIVLF